MRRLIGGLLARRRSALSGPESIWFPEEKAQWHTATWALRQVAE